MNSKKLFSFLFSSVFLFSACTTPEVHIGNWVSDPKAVEIIVETNPDNEEFKRIVKEYSQPLENERYGLTFYKNGKCDLKEYRRGYTNYELAYRIENGELFIITVSMGKVTFLDNQMILTKDALGELSEDADEMLEELSVKYDGRFDSIKITKLVEINTFNKTKKIVEKPRLIKR